MYVHQDEEFVINNINVVIKEFKAKSRLYEINLDTDMIKHCLENNQDFNMVNQLNAVTYAGRIKKYQKKYIKEI